MKPYKSTLCNGCVCVCICLFVFVIGPDGASQTLHDLSLFIVLFSCKLPLGVCKQFDPGAIEVVGQVMWSFETNPVHREFCAELLSPQDMTSRWPAIRHPDLNQHFEFPLASSLQIKLASIWDFNPKNFLMRVIHQLNSAWSWWIHVTSVLVRCYANAGIFYTSVENTRPLTTEHTQKY